MRNSGAAKFALAAAIAAMLLPVAVAAQAEHSSAKPPKPDLHAGGFSPSAIPNGETTAVTLPGFHLSGARIETGPQCKVISSEVSDQLIKMNVKGTRSVDDKDDTCMFHFHTAGGTASNWLVVELTDAEKIQQATQQRAEENAKAQAFIARTGKAWHLSFAGGATETYTATGANDDAMPEFQKKSGGVAKIAVSNDKSIMFIESGCMRTGKLIGTQVKDGQSQGDCTPPGAWTATVDR